MGFSLALSGMMIAALGALLGLEVALDEDAVVQRDESS
jgi:hypothetical protein